MNFPVALPSFVLAAAMIALPVCADAPKQSSPEAQALRKAQGMLRQLTQEKAALEAEKAGNQEQIKKLEAKVQELQSAQDKLKSHADALQTNKDALEDRVGRDAERIQSLSEKQREALALLKQYHADNQLLIHAVGERSEWVAGCHEKNQSLLDANRSLLEKYQDKGFWEELSEPVTGLGTVQTENQVQEYRFKLEDLQVSAFAAQKKSAGGEGHVPDKAENAPTADAAGSPHP